MDSLHPDYKMVVRDGAQIERAVASSPTRSPSLGMYGFTLIELLFVLAIIALLAGIVAPMLTGSIDRARESTLRQDLYTFRKAIDDYYADNGRYPGALADLVDKRYIRAIPVDPTTDKTDTWVVDRVDDGNGEEGIIDVHSGSKRRGHDGVAYRDW